MQPRSASRAPSALPVDRTVTALRGRVAAWRAAGEEVALVPTMGALHQGHLALVRAAGERAKRVVVSIFVNPAQFAPNEDFSSYPRDEAADMAKLASLGVDAVFAPDVAEIYPPGFATSITVAGPALDLESDFRPHFLGGVATVVAKLLLSCLPDAALFGEKDYQQLIVVRRIVTDLSIPTEIVGLPTIREADGLALSSRNAYLSPAERKIAPRLFAVLNETALGIRGQAPPVERVIAAEQALDEAGFRVDYVALRNAATLAPVADVGAEPLRLLAAAWLGKTRLIDNVPV
jgi:pantoate--beta-alanine ligase